MKYCDEINSLIEALSKYQGIGQKTAERLAISTVTKWSNEEIDNFASALVRLKSLKRCKKCGNITKNDICEICATRNNDRIMVIEDVKDLLVELEEYILSIDEDHLDQIHPDYHDKMAVLYIYPRHILKSFRYWGDLFQIIHRL